MGTGTVPSPHPLPRGCLVMVGCLLPAASCPPLFPQGCVPTRPIFMWAPSLPGGLLIPTETGRGIVDRAAISLEQANSGLAAAAGLRDTLSLPQPAHPGTRPPQHDARWGCRWDAKGMVARGTPAVKADRFSVAPPVPRSAVSGVCWWCLGWGAGRVPWCRAEPREGTSAGWHQSWQQ